ncbi:MAG: hypothetical protein KDB23_31845, partial [Planctomycetales bacterium]|nr:hypothetical protein [Planctomycetales bacterium]
MKETPHGAAQRSRWRLRKTRAYKPKVRDRSFAELLEQRHLLAIDVAGTLPDASTWSGTVHVTNDLVLPASASLNIEPGTVVKLNQGVHFQILGSMNAVGNAGQFIVFTSTNDDTIGEDLTATATTAVPGSWDALWIDSATTILDHAEIRFAGNRSSPGNGSWRTPAVHVAQSPTLRSVTISDSENQGLIINGGAPTFEDLLVERSGREAIYLKPVATPTFTRVSASDNVGGDRVTLESGTITVDQTWDFSGLPVHLTDDLAIDAAATLTITPGTIVKLPYGAHLDARGNILANGTADEPIIFTSVRDDVHGG